MKKRGQVAIFIILGVVIVAGIGILVLILSKAAPKVIAPSGTTNSNAFLAECLSSRINQDVGNLTLHGGSFSSPINLTFQFNKSEGAVIIPYLCYTSSYDASPCINQRPLLIQSFQNNLKSLMENRGDVKGCFQELISNLKSQGYKVTDNYNGFDLKLNYSSLTVKVDAQLTQSKGSTESFDGFTAQVPMDQYGVYNLLSTVQSIVNKEASSCGFFANNVALYPNFKVTELTDTVASSRVYVVSDRQGRYTFRFAVRGCVSRI